MRKTLLKRLLPGVPVGLAVAMLAAPALAAHFGVPLRDTTGATIGAANGNLDQPYSPKQTCGRCHDYATITAGYHFQQGFDELIAEADRVAGEKPFIKSPGMYGKW